MTYTKETFVEALRDRLKKALNRGDKHVSNITVQRIYKVYRSKGFNSANDIIKDLETIKGAKSVDDLEYNIMHDLRAGTRSDGLKVEAMEIDLFE